MKRLLGLAVLTVLGVGFGGCASAPMKFDRQDSPQFSRDLQGCQQEAAIEGSLWGRLHASEKESIQDCMKKKGYKCLENCAENEE